MSIFNIWSLRWTTQLGSDPMSPEQQSDLAEERQKAQQEYLLTQAEFSQEDEFSRTKTQCFAARSVFPLISFTI